MKMNKKNFACRKKTPQTFFLDYKSAVQNFHLRLFYVQYSKAGVTPICIQVKHLWTSFKSIAVISYKLFLMKLYPD